MMPIVLRSLSVLEKEPHACDVYGSRDFKYPSRGVLYSFERFEGLSVETASRDGKCHLLTVDISTGSILSYSKCLFLLQYICFGIQLYVAE
jgi:hypothetical protein